MAQTHRPTAPKAARRTSPAEYLRAMERLDQAERQLRAAKDLLSKARPDSTPRDHPTKADQIMAQVQRKRGASLEGLAARMGVMQKTIRSVISRESRKRGVDVTYQDGRYFAR